MLRYRGVVEKGKWRVAAENSKKDTSEEENTKEEPHMNAALEEWGTFVHNLGRRVCLRLCGQLGPTVLVAALRLVFDCPNTVLRGPLSICADYLVAHKKCHECPWEAGGLKHQEYARV